LNPKRQPFGEPTPQQQAWERYQNEDLDSVILSTSEADTIGPFKTGDCCTMTAEVYNIEYVSSQYGIFYEQFVGYVISRGSTGGGYIYLSSFLVGDHSRNAEIVFVHDSLNLNGTTYRRVVEMEIHKDYYVDQDMRFFYVDSVGIIKKILINSMNDSTIWQLVSYTTELLIK
jgi:hypothetical protein